MKIMIYGYSGSGKSTLGKTLANHYQIDVLHIDAIHFSAGWVERNKDIRNQELDDFIEKNENWIVDGNYTQAHFQKRVAFADQIFFLDFNRFICLKNVLLRYKRFKVKSRDSIAKECNEKVDFSFVWWVLYRGRLKKRIATFKKIAIDYPNKVIVFKNRKQMHRYLQDNHISYVPL